MTNIINTADYPCYDDLRKEVRQLAARVAALEAQHEAQNNVIADLAAQLAQHAAAPMAHANLRPLGLVVLDGLSAAYDYDVTAQTDGPLLVDDALTDAQRDRIWRRVQTATAPEYTVYRPDEVQP